MFDKVDRPWRMVPIEKGPPWVESDLFTIEATAGARAGLGTMLGPMMHSLLEDRFRLIIHTESREAPVYALSRTDDGHRPHEAGPCPMPPIDTAPPPAVPHYCWSASITDDGLDIHAVNMAQFTSILSDRLDRDVVDRTRLEGSFDFQIALPAAARAAGAETSRYAANRPRPSSAESEKTIAAIRSAIERLGLTLQAARAPVEVFVIDRVGRPSEN